MHRNPTIRLVLDIVSVFVGIEIAVVLWTQLGNISTALKVLFSLFIVGILIYNTRQVFFRRNR